MPQSMLKQQSKGSMMRSNDNVLVAYLVPKILPIVLARIYGYQTPASLAVFKNKSTQQYEIAEVPL
jgi:hypothetical protein